MRKLATIIPRFSALPAVIMSLAIALVQHDNVAHDILQLSDIA